MTKHTGHLLIATDWGQFITPATFSGNGLAVHPSIGWKGVRGDGYTVTHVSSGLALRTFLTRPVAYRLMRALAQENWWFHKDAVRYEHATKVREILEAA